MIGETSKKEGVFGKLMKKMGIPTKEEKFDTDLKMEIRFKVGKVMSNGVRVQGPTPDEMQAMKEQAEKDKFEGAFGVDMKTGKIIYRRKDQVKWVGPEGDNFWKP